MFVGQPRTGHSLVGALLDAHPNALVAHELDALKYVAAGYDRRRLFALLVAQERAGRRRARLVDGLHLRRCPGSGRAATQRLEVIGDKKGGRSTHAARRRHRAARPAAATTVGVDVHVVHVVRNPYDVIATMHRRAPNRPLPDVVELFFELADTVDEVAPAPRARARSTSSTSSDLIADPCGDAGRAVPVPRAAGAGRLPRGVQRGSCSTRRAAPATTCRGRPSCSTASPPGRPSTRRSRAYRFDGDRPRRGARRA